jgi:hypothetical protein
MKLRRRAGRPTESAARIVLKTALLAGLFFQAGATGQELLPVFDARAVTEPAALSGADEKLMKDVVLPAAGAFWGMDCPFAEGAGRIIDAAPGAFTRPGVSQLAILYRQCEYGHNFARNGIAVIEDGRLAAHLVYDAAWDSGLEALPDIDGDGLSEILVETGGTNMGETWRVVRILELTRDGVEAMGSFPVSSDNGGTLEAEPRAMMRRLMAKRSPRPAFFQEEFVGQSRGAADVWEKVGGLEPVMPEEDPINYERIEPAGEAGGDSAGDKAGPAGSSSISPPSGRTSS